MSSGLEVQVFSAETPYRGVDVWTDEALIRWDWAAPQIFRGADERGARKLVDPQFLPFPWSDVLKTTPELWDSDDYLVGSIRSFIDALATGSKLWVSGHNLRQALEIAIASKLSAQLGNQPVWLPLEDRSLALYPSPYWWRGGDATGRPQSAGEAASARSGSGWAGLPDGKIPGLLSLFFDIGLALVSGWEGEGDSGRVATLSRDSAPLVQRRSVDFGRSPTGNKCGSGCRRHGGWTGHSIDPQRRQRSGGMGNGFAERNCLLPEV